MQDTLESFPKSRAFVNARLQSDVIVEIDQKNFTLKPPAAASPDQATLFWSILGWYVLAQTCYIKSMSSGLMRLLSSSWLWGPWRRLSVADEAVSRVFSQSLWARLLSTLPCVRMPEAWHQLLSKSFLTGWIGVLALCTVADTGVIAVGIWAMATFSVLFSAFIRAKNSHPDRSSPLSIIDLAIALYWASGLISTLASSIQPESLSGLFKLTTLMAAYAGLRVTLRLQANSPWHLVLALAVLGGLQGAIGVWQFQHHVQPLATWSDPTINPELSITRVFGTLKPLNPNLYAGFLLPALAAALSALGFVVIRYRGVLRLANVMVSLLLAGLILFGIVMSGSRGGYLGLLGVGLTGFALVGHWLWQTDSQKWISSARKLWLGSGLLAITGVALAISLMPALRTRVLSIGSLWEDSSIAYRLQVYQTALRMIQDNWLVGIGPGNETFRQIFGAYAPAHLHALGAYSIPLEILVELGVLGALVAVSFVILLALRCLIAIEHRPENPPENPSEQLLNLLLLLGGCVAIVAVLANGLFDTVWYRPAVQVPFWLWVAVLVDTSGRVLNPKNGRMAMRPSKNLY